jgi:hypothetical protein
MGGPLTKTFETGDGQRVLGSRAEITHENNNQKKNSVHFIINQQQQLKEEGVISQQQRGGLNFIMYGCQWEREKLLDIYLIVLFFV